MGRSEDVAASWQRWRAAWERSELLLRGLMPAAYCRPLTTWAMEEAIVVVVAVGHAPVRPVFDNAE